LIQRAIEPTVGSPGNYDFAWESEAGKLYDVASATDLSTPASTWLVWDGRGNLVAMPPTNILTHIPDGGVPLRYFAMISRDAP
jgi:hypothetical protein